MSVVTAHRLTSISTERRTQVRRNKHTSCLGGAPRGPRDELGAVLVEFAVAMLFLPLVSFGIVDFGRAYHIQTQLRNAAREGASYGQFFPANVGTASCAGSPSSQTIIGRATNADASISIASSDVHVYKNGSTPVTNCTTTFQAGDTLTVTVNGSFKLLTPLVSMVTGQTTYPLSASQTVVVQR